MSFRPHADWRFVVLVASIVLIAGLIGGAIGFFMQWWTMSVDYPFNSGGRPFNSWHSSEVGNLVSSKRPE